MKSIQLAINLLNQKKDIEEVLTRLKKMDYPDKVTAVKFESDYTADAAWHSTEDEGELCLKLVKTAMEHLQGRLNDINTLVGLADMALERELTKEVNSDDEKV